MAFPLAQLLANSLIIGSVYALVAGGFSLIYSTSRLMHFAHGASVAAAGYVLYSLFALLGIPFWLSALLTLIAAGLLGYATNKFLYAPLRAKDSSTVILLIASVAALLLIENLIQLFFGADVKSVGLIETQRGLEVLGATVTPLQLVIIAAALVLLGALYWFMNHTRTGRHLRAVADNPELADIMGIDADRLVSLAFVIGSVLAGVAGVLIGLEQNLSPSMGTHLIVQGFTGAVIGGITSVPAAVVGSYVLGGVENFAIWWLPSGFKQGVTFLLLFGFLLFKPSGLFGVDKGVRE